MNQCAGWCQENKSCTEYRETMLQARELLKGNYKAVAEQLRDRCSPPRTIWNLSWRPASATG